MGAFGSWRLVHDERPSGAAMVAPRRGRRVVRSLVVPRPRILGYMVVDSKIEESERGA